MKRLLAIIIVATGIVGCNAQKQSTEKATKTANLPEPYATPAVRNNSTAIGWPEGKTPIVPAGFTITKFADGFNNPRWIYVANNGDVFVAEARTGSNPANRITLFRDTNSDGKPDVRENFEYLIE